MVCVCECVCLSGTVLAAVRSGLASRRILGWPSFYCVGEVHANSEKELITLGEKQDIAYLGFLRDQCLKL